ncbi:glycoside hydrolase family 2 TIM barrel-domain containing protein [Saccharicrinis sp. FJH54]|uniref:glycoside hydrolase family 2 TIM barrel-domain containing protein n=1 Tax=Saccharicrinis sp. FJH54 TaxID=3344665 RepID=UPI0035D48199
MKLNLLAVILIFTGIFSTVKSQQRSETVLQNGWKFHKGEAVEAFKKDFDDSQWESVSVPHDWAVSEPFIKDGDGSTGKLPWKAEGWYRKTLKITGDIKNKEVILLCDGIMAFPEIYVNGKLAGKWDYGYNSFYLNITDLINADTENVLAIHADTRNHDSRWYPGGGIFRKIKLITVNPIHVDIWGTQITTPVVQPNYADVRIGTMVTNSLPADADVVVIQSIYNHKKELLAERSVKGRVKSGKSERLETTLTLGDPDRWDIDHPYLYTVITRIYHEDNLVDTYHSSFGVREMRFTADHGFYLNNRRVQLKGVNLHSDLGPLGMAFNKRAMERQLEIMKDMGCNAIRTSHNVPAPELLELCDSMGLLVYNEAFDKYDRKADITDTTDFDAFAKRNIGNFVKRDRNHPCIFIWSVGNEMHDVQTNSNNGLWRLHTMVNYVRKYDPTRPVTMACDMTGQAANRHFDFYDVHSWNYQRRYMLARQLEPEKAVIVSESASTVSTRGFYEFPLPAKPADFTNSLQVSSYDLNAPYWAEIPDDDFKWQQEEPYVAGEFVWTGFDYIGEPTPYDNRWAHEHGMTDEAASRSSYFGIVDLCGIPKDRYYLYKSFWKPDENMLHILPHWNWEGREGEETPVFVYTNGDCAELFLNGKSLGKQCKKPDSRNSVDRFRLMWDDVKYEPGELKVIAYMHGEKIGEQTLNTTGDPVKLRISPDRKTIKADDSDLSFILIEAVDKDGNVCPLADNKINILIKGNGKIACVGNGNPQSFNRFQSNSVDLFYGKAMLIVQSGFEPGKITVEASTEGLKKAVTTLETK